MPQDSRRLVSWALLILFVLAAAIAMWRSWDVVQSSVADMGFRTMALSAVLAVMGVHLFGLCWLSLARDAGLVAPARAALGMFYVSQLGKYVPGSVWPAVAQMEFGRRWGTPRRALLTAYALLIVVLCASGLSMGLSVLSLAGDGGLEERWWLLLLVPVFLAGLHPRVVPSILDRLSLLTGQEPLRLEVRTVTMVKALACAAAAWVVLGLHVMVLLSGLGESGGQAFAQSVGAISLGWAAGLIVVLAPAGLGVRDSVIIATFAGLLGGGGALAVAVASRVLMLVADLVLASVGGLALARTAGRSG
jgi:glycosyltransferase 2 family protein